VVADLIPDPISDRSPSLTMSTMESFASGASARPRFAEAGSLLQGVCRAVAVVGAGAFVAWLVANAVRPASSLSGYGWDFGAMYAAGHAFLHLHSPYVAPSLANLTSGENFVYPPPIAALFAPLSLLPYPVATVVFIVASGVLFGAALRLLGIRDWRCYAAAFLSMPLQSGLKLGTLSPLLAFLLALVWRYRDRTSVAAPALGLLVVSKLFLWPVALLFLLTRRFRTFWLAATGSVAAVFLSALPLGPGVLTSFPKLLDAVSHFESRFSFSPYATAMMLGLPSAAAAGVAVLLGGTLLIAAARSAQTDESRAFRTLVVASLVFSPLVWWHYLAIIFVPLALWRPRFSPLWLLSAWAFGQGFGFGHGAFLVTSLCVLIVIPFQAGLVELPGLRQSVARWLPREAAVAGLWLPAAVVLLGATSAVPAVAALTPTVAAPASASGTAFVRLLTHHDGICWRIWAENIPAGASADLVGGRGATVVASRPLAPDGRQTCFGIEPAESSSLTSTYRRRSGDYRLLVRDRAGRVLLRGDLRRQVDVSAVALRRASGR
jgi:hypothetical protein